MRAKAWSSLGVFLVALALRLVGINWGLANDLHRQSYHPDEPIVFLYARQIEPAQGKFTPGFYNYGTLYLTAIRVLSDGVAAYTGGNDPRDPDAFWAYVSRVHGAGRVLSALAGAWTALLVFLMLRRWVGPLASGMGAGLAAFAPGFVVHSRFQTVDVLATALLAASTYYALRLIPAPGEEPPPDRAWLRDALLSGLFAGLSAGTKYTGVLALATLAVAALASRRGGGLKALALGSLVAGVAFVVVTPGILLDSERFWTDFRYEMTHTSTGHGLVFAGTANGFIYHFTNLLVGVGPILTLLGLGGLLWAAIRRERWAWAALAFFGLYFLLIGRAEVKFLRYTFPLLIGLALGFGYLVQRWSEGGRWGRVGVAVAIAGLGGMDPGGLRQAALWTGWMTGEDPRDAAARYLRAEPPAPVGLASDPWFYTPPTWRDSAIPRTVPLAQRMAQMAEAQPPTLFYQNPAGAFDWDVGLLDQRPERIAISSFEFYDVLRLRGVPLTDPVQKLIVERGDAFIRRLEAEYEHERILGADYVPVHDIMYVHPSVVLWKRKTP